MSTRKILAQIAAQEDHPWAASINKEMEKKKRVQAASKWITKQLTK
jgi:hypothetical protein